MAKRSQCNSKKVINDDNPIDIASLSFLERCKIGSRSLGFWVGGMIVILLTPIIGFLLIAVPRETRLFVKEGAMATTIALIVSILLGCLVYGLIWMLFLNPAIYI